MEFHSVIHAKIALILKYLLLYNDESIFIRRLSNDISSKKKNRPRLDMDSFFSFLDERIPSRHIPLEPFIALSLNIEMSLETIETQKCFEYGNKTIKILAK